MAIVDDSKELVAQAGEDDLAKKLYEKVWPEVKASLVTGENIGEHRITTIQVIREVVKALREEREGK